MGGHWTEMIYLRERENTKLNKNKQKTQTGDNINPDSTKSH